MIAIDIDGVLADFLYGFSRMVRSIDPEAPLITSYDEAVSWGTEEWYWPEKDREYIKALNEEAWQRIFQSHDFWMRLPPMYPGLHPVLEALRHKAVFMTRRDGIDPYGQTMRWLRYNGINEPLLVRVASGEEKGDICRNMGIARIVEDSPTYALQAAESGVNVHLLDYPYNRGVEHPNIQRIGNLAESLWITGERG